MCTELDTLSVKQIMDRWPATVGVFLEHGMRCIGCPIGPFHTLEDAAREHGRSLKHLQAELAYVIGLEQPRHDTVADEQ